jgi:hypothetical protein
MSNNAIARQPGTVLIEDARIVFRNFAGLEGQYNRAGDRNFGVILPPDIAQQMEQDGWNVKYLKPREDDEGPTPWVSVSVSYKGRPPTIVMITDRYDRETGEVKQQRVTLPEELVEMVDYADIAKADLILNPYVWNVSGKSGVKAYLKSLFITIRQDELERKYAGIEEVRWDGSPLQIGSTAHEPSEEDLMLEEQEDGSFA